MKEQLITFETAKLAKEKGFPLSINPHSKDIPFYTIKGNLIYKFNGLRNTSIVFASTQSLLQKWLREEHDISVVVLHFPKYNDKGEKEYVEYRYSYIDNAEVWDEIIRHKSYEEALEKGLQEALKLI